MSTGAHIVGSGTDMANGPGPEVMAAATLDGDRVMSSDGHDVGKLKDIMLDIRSGRIAYAVLSTGGFLGIGDKLLAIPWSALTLDTDNKCFVLSLTAERVKNAPGFDKGHWPSMADATWATSIHQYYGREPYWNTSADMSRDGRDSRYRSPSSAPSSGYGVDDVLPGSSDAPEAGGVKL
jgi:sporulation protein YlmC with PRC-barrel domain